MDYLKSEEYLSRENTCEQIWREKRYVKGGLVMYPTDLCWETGEFTDDCCCDFCEHREECSGYDKNDDDDD